MFGRPIGQNQGIQFPIAKAYAQMRAAELMVHEAASLYEQGKDCGAEANMAKMLAADASWAAADMCVQTHGGFGFAEEFDIERKFRETRLYSVAPISTNLILSYLAEHVLGLPRSYLMLPLEGLLVVRSIRRSRRRSVLPPRRCRRARHQDRTARGRFRARLRYTGARRERLFRLAQSRQGIGRSRPQRTTTRR